MISYLVATIPWTFGCLALGPRNPKSIKYRRLAAGFFYGMIAPLVYFFIQHKVHRVPGAYTTYAFFEWSLVLFDVAFDAVTAIDFAAFEIVVKDVQGVTKGSPSTAAAEPQHAAAYEKASKVVKATPVSDALDMLASVYHGFVFWSILTSLGVCIWYFPLWHMGLSGYEVFVMTPATPGMSVK
ncbi:Protein cwh43, partial [Ascosphaera atra]